VTRRSDACLIIGQSGQDGRLLRKHLEAQGREVVGVGRPTSRRERGCVELDIRDGESVDRRIASLAPSEIYYFAAHHGSSETMAATGNPETIRSSWETHVVGFANIMAAVEKCSPDSRVLLASSALVYAPAEVAINESHPLLPDSIYGVTKAAAMLLARECRKRGLFVQTAVLFPHESALRPETFVASKIARTALRISEGSGENIILGDPNAVVDWSLASDVVRALATMMATAPAIEFIVSSGIGCRVGDLATSVCRRLGLDPDRDVSIDPNLLRRASARRVGDPTLLASHCDWSVGRTVDEFSRLLLSEFSTESPKPQTQEPLDAKASVANLHRDSSH